MWFGTSVGTYIHERIRQQIIQIISRVRVIIAYTLEYFSHLNHTKLKVFINKPIQSNMKSTAQIYQVFKPKAKTLRTILRENVLHVFFFFALYGFISSVGG